MTKNEFLDSLREYLSYELPERLVKPQMQYYQEYFREQAALGKSAQTVCEELGDPQLIARTIIDSEKAGADGIPNSDDDPDFHEEMYGTAEETRSQDGTGSRPFGGNEAAESGGAETRSPFRGGELFRSEGRAFGCLPLVIAVLIVVLLVNFVFSLLGSIFRGGSVMTVLLLILLGWTIYKYYIGKRK